MNRIKRLSALALVLFLLANALPAQAWEKPGKHIAKGLNFVVAVQADGTVKAAGDNTYGQCDVQEWRDVVAVAAGYAYALGLKKDGTVYAAGNNEYGQCSVSGWKDIVMVTATLGGSYGLTGDGRVLRTYDKPSLGKTETEKWRDIVWIDCFFGTPSLPSTRKEDPTACPWILPGSAMSGKHTRHFSLSTS